MADCSFTTHRDRFLGRESQVRREASERSRKLGGAFAGATSEAPPTATSIPQRNFIDAEIFGKMARLDVHPARLTTDQEFVRRIYLDLTGRIPSPDDIRSFVADTTANKRDLLIDKLLNSPEYADRWTMWLGDLLQNTAASTNIARQANGRNAFYRWLKKAVTADKSYKDIAYEVVAAAGNNYDDTTGPANFPVGAITPMGPIQDQYDTMLSKTASTFLGLAYYDCLLCHNGRGHLEQISLWGGATTRLEAQRMAAFFSRQLLTRDPAPAPPQGETAPFYYLSYTVTDRTAGTYDLNTNYGNRPNRVPIGTLRNLTPEYRLGGTPAGQFWRDSFAANMVNDPMFARNIVNRLWKQMFNLGLVDPLDSMDPARLDPSNPPSAPWTLQATHPELLEQLAQAFVRGNFSLRSFHRLIAESSAYQLSSRYEGEWKLEYVPLFARHYPRRLEGEEVHDAVAKATGVLGNYTVAGWDDRVYWAMQLPEPVEPRTDGGANAFMNTFFRGNRDNQQRNQAGSIQQQLYLMNDAFVTNRTKVNSSPRLGEIARLATKNDEALDALYLLFLSRFPDDSERAAGLKFLTKANTTALRNSAIEDLAWACINKIDFLFSY